MRAGQARDGGAAAARLGSVTGVDADRRRGGRASTPEPAGFRVMLAAQAGCTVGEDFPGLAALVAPTGEVAARLPDWREGTLIAYLPLTV